MAKTSKVMKGMGITAAVAAAAAGAYFLYGTSEGKKQRKKIKGWALKAKGEVLEQMENLKDINEVAYNKVVDEMAKRYKTIKSVDPVELAAMARELKGHWKNIQKEFNAGKQKVKKMANSGVKTAKKVKTKKTAKRRR